MGGPGLFPADQATGADIGELAILQNDFTSLDCGAVADGILDIASAVRRKVTHEPGPANANGLEVNHVEIGEVAGSGDTAILPVYPSQATGTYQDLTEAGPHLRPAVAPGREPSARSRRRLAAVAAKIAGQGCHCLGRSEAGASGPLRLSF
jgi:hypothetical protein